ncbi:ParA family protein [Levilactobacillus fuyuanensis]|uniref:ParA family protein n=1 Tax=Levilactobacillus fuyuanensis TaxID=2486022 RepID=A0ABW4H086_9LACO|nr:ParA family protein [Levilactobacillus fuyuanensis]
MSNEGKTESEKAKVISFINMKGGVGKTTLTKEIGFRLANSLGKKVLLIDVDPQINLTQSIFKYFNYAQSAEIAQKLKKQYDNSDEDSENEDANVKTTKVSTASIKKVFEGNSSSPANLADCVLTFPDSNLSIIPGELGIEFTTRNLNSAQLENGIYNFIDKQNLRSLFDYILIDCPPTYSSYTVAALKPSDFYVIPVKPEAYSILGINMLSKVVKTIVDDNRIFFKEQPLHNLGIILTDIKSKPSAGIKNLIQDISSSNVLKNSGIDIFKTRFLHNPYLQSDISYFIDTSNAEKGSKPNLNKLVKEFQEKVNRYE